MSTPENDQDGLGEDAHDEGLTAAPDERLTGKTSRRAYMLRGIRGASDKRLLMLVIGLGVCAGIYFIYEATGGTRVHSTTAPAPQTTYIQGTKAPTPAYRQMLEQQDAQRAAKAAQTGGSALPTIVASSPVTSSSPGAPTSPAPDETPVAPATPATPILPAAPAQQSSMGTSQVVHTAPSIVNVNPNRVQAMVKEMEALNSAMSGGPIKEVRFSSNSETKGATGQAGGYPSRAYTGTASGGAQQAAKATPASTTTARPAGPYSAPAPGTRLAAVLDGMDSDAPGPVTGVIEQGPLTGARLLGQAETTRDGAAIRFTSMTVPYRNADGQLTTQTVSISAWAISPSTGTTDVATSVNHHLAEQLAVAFTTSLLSNFGQLIANSGASTVINPTGAIAVTNPALSTTDQLASAAGSAAGTAGTLFQQIYGNQPTTIKVAPGTPCTLLFVGSN
ncbi:hypothetical protein FE249_18170 (plasmid) [Acidiphilium multivorum]|uniref:hypothetical protein n=1 Tax=Acidiphilium multivorum TaxID=62140 RepID=UPI001F4C1451|nr:hypothetical protein [Acidiphilium multivorum]UNC16182.1 hypothetical protein FE249_18170 [Acidiphilium multivorum]